MARRFRNIIGPKVRKLRAELGLTQDQLAARLQLAGLTNVDRVTVAKIESQIRSVYDFEVLVLANVLKVDANDLMAISSKAFKVSLPTLLHGAMPE
jgi:transcriptional regulator with XRE-family HTH domain